METRQRSLLLQISLPVAPVRAYLRILANINRYFLPGFHIHVAGPKFLAAACDRQMMCSGRQQQLLLPDPEIVVEFVHMTHKIAGRFSVRQDGGSCFFSGNKTWAPRTANLL